MGFETLGQRYRCEYYYKANIVSKVVFGRHSPRTSNALLELPMGEAVADVVVVNGTTTVYELKTDLDNFDRLEAQLAQYRTRAEFVNVVVSHERSEQALRTCPEWVGVLGLRSNGVLSQVRRPESLLNQLVPRHMFELLRTEEARRAVHRSSGRLVSAPPGVAWSILREEFAALTPAQANAAVVAELRKRGASAGELASAPSFPRSMRALAYAQPLSGVGRERLVTAMASPVAAFR